ncbi:MAG: crossover junction endodeoxyribonuclease RuvC [Clostridia bacterium]
MRILGIDPGYAILGYGVIESDKNILCPVDYGVIETTPNEAFPRRLEKLYDGTKQLMAMFSPDVAIFEELFFYRNTTTALSVGAGRGIAILVAQQARLPIYEYTPMQIKLAVTGNGHADKLAVQTMVKMLLSLKTLPKPDDAADALAAAICHGSTIGPAAEDYRIQ